jgi:exopolyphosphatase/guanosine-5'-triphosphate,3'-diphosphate pyrophosphatase
VKRFVDPKQRQSWSQPLGALRLADRFLHSDPPRRGELRELRAYVHERYRRAGIPPLSEGESLIGTGGTVRNLARLDATRTAHPIQRLHAYELSRRHLQEIARNVAVLRLKERRWVPGLNPRRADSIIAGSIAIECLMDDLDADRLMVAGQGLREGLMIEASGLEIPPPPAVRSRSVAALASRFTSWDETRATRRLALVERLFQKLEPHPVPGLQEALGHAAVVLDIGRNIDYYERHGHTAVILKSTNLLGFTHRDILLLSAIVERAEDESWSLERYRPLLHEEDHMPLERAAVILSLADRIENRLSLRRTPLPACEVRRRKVVLDEPCLSDWDDEDFRERFQRAFRKELITPRG